MTDTMAAKTSSSNSTFLRTECSFPARSKQHTHNDKALTVVQMMRCGSDHHDTRSAVPNLFPSTAVALRTSKAPETGVVKHGPQRALKNSVYSP